MEKPRARGSAAVRQIQVELVPVVVSQVPNCSDTSLAATTPEGYSRVSMAVMQSPGLQDQAIIFCF